MNEQNHQPENWYTRCLVACAGMPDPVKEIERLRKCEAELCNILNALARCFKTDVCMDGSTPMIGGVSKVEFVLSVLPAITSANAALSLPTS